MLTRLYVDNFRCLVNFECRFGAKQLILGPNGSGKTTVFDALAVLRDFCVSGLPMEHALVGFTRTRWQNVPEQTFELEVSGNGGTYSFRLVIDSWGRPERPRIVREEVHFSGNPIFRFAQGEVNLFNDRYEQKVAYPFDWHRSALATVAERAENTKLWWFKRWLGNLVFIGPDPRQMVSIADTEAPGPARNLSNFASWYRHLRLESDDQALMADLRNAMPGFVSMDLKDAGMGNRVLMLTFSIDEARGQQSLAFHELSDGQRVLVGLYGLLHFALNSRSTLFLDEPDNFISLREIQPWLDKVIDKVDEELDEAQIVLISHHPELLNRLAVQSGMLFERPGGRHTRARPYDDPAQTGLSPAELVARGWDHE